MKPHRRHSGYRAFLMHRLSGLGLVLFLPLHFLVLGLALRHSATLDGFLRWTQQPLVELAEAALVALLAVHLTGGLRLLLLELLAWRGGYPFLISAGTGLALLVGMLFLLNAT